VALVKHDIDNIMNRITQKLTAEAKDSLRKVILYGSYARGDFHEDSDVDIMVLVDSPNPRSVNSVIAKEESLLWGEYDTLIMCVFQNYKHFYEAMDCTSFYKNVEREGIVYYDSTT